MEKVITTLKQLGIKETELPEAIQDRIESLESMVKDHNLLVDSLEEKDEVTDEEEQLVESQSDKIDALDAKIADEINAFHDAKEKSKEKAKLDAVEKAKKEAEEKSKQETPKPVEEKKSSKGWMIFGALALVVTLGAVNVMNKD